jgi:hypothetical protein
MKRTEVDGGPRPRSNRWSALVWLAMVDPASRFTGLIVTGLTAIRLSRLRHS